MMVDASWQRLALARQKGLPFYHGEILNEATEHNLDLTPYAMLVAATENEAYNTLVCNEFAHEIGRDTVFQLGDAVDGDDKHSLPEASARRALFETGFGVEDVNERLAQGWVFRKTKLSEEFDFEAAQQRLPDAASMLLLVRDNGTIRFFTHAAREPRAGDVIVGSHRHRSAARKTPPQSVSRKRNKTAEQGLNMNLRPLPLLPGTQPALAACGEDEGSATRVRKLRARSARSFGRSFRSSRSRASNRRDRPLETLVQFPEGAELTEEARAELATILASPQVEQGGPIILRGHSDGGGSDEGNMRASRARRSRARLARRQRRGRSADQHDRIRRTESRRPECRPDGSPDPVGRAANRRVEIEVRSETPNPKRKHRHWRKRLPVRSRKPAAPNHPNSQLTAGALSVAMAASPGRV